jgi:integrase
MIGAGKGILLTLTGGVTLKQRVQRPKVHERKDRGTYYWFFRYRQDVLQPDGSIKTTRPFRTLGPSRGHLGLSKREAEAKRDALLSELNAGYNRPDAAARGNQPVEVTAILFGRLAEMWRRDYIENPKVRLAEPTRAKYRMRLTNHILPRWSNIRLGEMRPKDILIWLQQECSSWHMMVDLRNIMSGIFTRAQEWEILPDSYANPLRRVKVGRKWIVRPDRIPTEEETAEIFARLEDPQLLICESCMSTGARISEVVGLQLRHVDLNAGTIKIVQRHCRGDVDEPKTKNSKRVLALGALIGRFERWIAKKGLGSPNDWIFAQEEDRTKPMWDSGVRKALKIAAVEAGCDFPDFGLHSFRRANITLRQEVGGSAIEASKIAGHATVNMTADYTVVQLKRQEELTRAIQERVAKSSEKRRNTCVKNGADLTAA